MLQAASAPATVSSGVYSNQPAASTAKGMGLRVPQDLEAKLRMVVNKYPNGFDAGCFMTYYKAVHKEKLQNPLGKLSTLLMNSNALTAFYESNESALRVYPNEHPAAIAFRSGLRPTTSTQPPASRGTLWVLRMNIQSLC